MTVPVPILIYLCGVCGFFGFLFGMVVMSHLQEKPPHV